MTKGLPGSGKSTWAKEQVKRLGWKRVNKDDLRAMIDCSVWSKSNEKLIIDIQTLIIKEFLAKGHTVVIDDTNFHQPHEERFKSMAEEFKVPFQIEDFSNVPLDVCIERDKKTQNYVGEDVIKRMHSQYFKSPSPKLVERDPGLLDCIIVDLDGTIANNTGVRGWFDSENVYLDNIKTEVLDVIEAFCKEKHMNTFVFSGRENTGSCLAETERWFKDKIFPRYPNFAQCLGTIKLRKENDHRKDDIVKKEMFDEFIKDRYNVLAVFDDRNQVVDMWRSLGLQVFQVSEGSF